MNSRGMRAAVAFVASLGTVMVSYLVNLLTGLVTTPWTRNLPLVLTVAVIAAVVAAGLAAWAAAGPGAEADPNADAATVSPPRFQHGHVQIGEMSGGLVVGQANGPVGSGAQQIINAPAQPADEAPFESDQS